jgi:hypothetical protein
MSHAGTADDSYNRVIGRVDFNATMLKAARGIVDDLAAARSIKDHERSLQAANASTACVAVDLISGDCRR